MTNDSSNNTNAQSKPFDIDPIGFDNKINYPFLYNQLVSKLNELHGLSRHDDAITHFSMMLGTFGGVFDEVFIRNCYEISQMTELNVSAIYQLQKVELSRLMTRAGIAPKPDIRIRYNAPWKVPTSIDDMSFDGSDKMSSKTKELNDLAKSGLTKKEHTNMKDILCTDCYQKYEDNNRNMEIGEACDICQGKLSYLCLSLGIKGEQ